MGFCEAEPERDRGYRRVVSYLGSPPENVTEKWKSQRSAQALTSRD